MREVSSFIGGVLVGAVIGVFLVSPVVQELSVPGAVVLGALVLSAVGGALLGRAAAPKPREPRLTGRVFEFPQGSVMVEVALKRMKSILPTKVVTSE